MEKIIAAETLSSNSLFHFTSKREYLESIIEYGFIPRYSMEDLTIFRLFFDSEGNPCEIGIPMVCFCDIPLSKVKYHIAWYGGYGIGLKKDWGTKRGVCPILYIDPLSETTKSIKNTLLSLEHLWINNENVNFTDYAERVKLIQRLIFFSKKYEGPFEHNTLIDVNKRFYDEREWRYVPDLLNVKDISQFILFDKDYEDTKFANNIAIENLYKEQVEHSLPVDPLSISYIIVQKDTDIIPIIRKIEDAFGEGQYSPNSLKRLMSRIITVDQIEKDF